MSPHTVMSEPAFRTYLEARVRAYPSQRAAAAALGIEPYFLSQVRRGVRPPGPTLLRALGLERQVTVTYTHVATGQEVSAAAFPSYLDDYIRAHGSQNQAARVAGLTTTFLTSVRRGQPPGPRLLTALGLERHTTVTYTPIDATEPGPGESEGQPPGTRAPLARSGARPRP